MKRKKLLKKLTKSKHHVKHLNVALSECEGLNRWFAAWAHEMRSPIVAMSQALTQIKNAQPDVQNQAWWSVAETSIQQVELGINDMLSLAQVQHQALLLQSQPFDLKSLLDSLKLFAESQKQNKPIELRLAVLEQSLWVEGDPFRLQQILQNLLTNAIKFTQTGWVTLDYETLSDRIVLRVSDSGVGMTEQQKLSLFKPFNQFIQAASGSAAGSGMGLFIVKQLVDAMQGTISVETNYGQGSCFTLNLPLRFLSDNEKNRQLNTETVVEQAVLPCSLLLVDDSALSRQVLRNLLINQPVAITEVENGQQALLALSQTDFQFVILDKYLADSDGQSLCQQIRKMQIEQQQPLLRGVYLLSAEPLASPDPCFDLCLVKPVDTKTLFRVLSLKEKIPQEKRKKNSCIKFIHVKIPNELIALLPQFIREVEQALSVLDEAFELADSERIMLSIHRLKGSLMLFQLSDMVTVITLVETRVKEGNLTDALIKFHQFKQGFAEFVASCEQH